METNGFKFLYDLLSQSNGNLKVCELPFLFKRRRFGKSKLNVYNIFLYIFSVINNNVSKNFSKKTFFPNVLKLNLTKDIKKSSKIWFSIKLDYIFDKY